MRYWIWSNEHGAWWRPNEVGYTQMLHEAGIYAEQHATQIVYRANEYLQPEEWPNEVMIPILSSYDLHARGGMTDEERQAAG